MEYHATTQERPSCSFDPPMQLPTTDPGTGSLFPSFVSREDWRLQQHSRTSYASASGLEETMLRVTLQSPEGMDGPYPERPGEPDCAYYMRTGLCGYGVRCRFNHPRTLAAAPPQGRGEYPERVGQPECQYYLKTGSCKFGPSCKYHHPRDKGGSVGRAQLNIVSLPLRPGEKDCAYYLRTGNCKYGVTCKFNHPQPRGVGTLLSMPPPLFSGRSAPISHQTHHPAAIQTWPIATGGSFFQSPRIQAPSSFTPLLLPSPQGFVSIPWWNTYHGSIESPDRQQQPLGTSFVYHEAPQQDPAILDSHGIFSPYMVGSSGSLRLPVPPSFATGSRDTFYPQIPGQPECQYYMKTGECKFGSTCKFHHPRDWIAPQAARLLNSIGLPFRPGAPNCAFYTRYGFCRYGSSCKFNHPFLGVTYSPSASSLVDLPCCVGPSSAISPAMPPARQPSTSSPSNDPSATSGTQLSHRQSTVGESLEEMDVSSGIEHKSVLMQNSAASLSG